MAATTYISSGIIVFIIGICMWIFRVDIGLYKKRPLPVSIVALTLITLNWILYLANFYAKIPESISDIIFMPIWFLVCTIGVFASLQEFKGNIFIALLMGGLSIISLIIGLLLLLIGSM